MEGGHEHDLVILLKLVFLLAFKLPISVVDEY